MAKQNGIKDLIGSLVDKDGLKTEVTITLTNATLTKIVLALLASGATVIVIAHLLKTIMPNKQLSGLQTDLNQIQLTLKNHLQ